jgi:L-ascorbate metabolism protein UlaG (beta-lactamase superfamily)
MPSTRANNAKRSASSIVFRWLGTAGIELAVTCYAGCRASVILIDPYLSRVPAWKLWFGRLSPAEELIAERILQCDLLLVTHAHFDHIMDVPGIARNTGAMAVGSRNSCELLRACGVSKEQIQEIRAGDALTFDGLSIEARPAEHRRIPGFAPGPLQPEFKLPLRASGYRMDDCYSYLISVNGHRLLTDPGVRPDDAVGADVLFVYPGMQTEYYKALLGRVQPRIAIPIHWDDFFRPLSKPLRPFWKLPTLAFPPLQHIDLEEFRQIVQKIAPECRVLEPEIFGPYELEDLLTVPGWPVSDESLSSEKETA